MKRFFGYGVQAVASENGVVSVMPVRPTGFGGIKVLEPGTIMPDQSTETETVVNPDRSWLAASVPPASAPEYVRAGRITSSIPWLIAQEPPPTRAIPKRDIGVPGAPGIETPPKDMEDRQYTQPFECSPGGPIVNAISMDAARVLCAAKSKSKTQRPKADDTTKYLLIGGVALVAILLLKK